MTVPGVATGAEACERALKIYGAKRIGVVTPTSRSATPTWSASSARSASRCLPSRASSAPPPSIAHVTEDELRPAILAVDGPDIDAIVQCGTNLSMVRLADEAERWPGKPVIAINAATWWMALRENGIATSRIGPCGTHPTKRTAPAGSASRSGRATS